MTESLSTLSIPLEWAAREERSNDLLQTGFFLFRDEEGHVVVREPGEKLDTSDESRVPATSLPSGSEVTEKNSNRPTSARVPQTRVLRGQPGQRYILLKKYEGFVTTRSKDRFSARLFESSSDYPVVQAEFDLEELSETDRELAVEGAPLVWTIGYAYEGSTRKRESLIYLRRLPSWSDKELKQGRKAAEDLTRGIRWE